MASRKHFSISRIAAVVALLAVGLPAAYAVGLSEAPAKVTRAEAGRALTPASTAKPEQVVSGFLATRGRSGAVVGSLRNTRNSPGGNGVTHVRMEQEVDGLAVYGAYAKAAVNSRGELVQVIDRLVDVTPVAASRIDAAAALRAAMARVHPGVAVVATPDGVKGNVASFKGGAFFHSAPTVTAVAVPLSNGTLARGWLVETWTAKDNLLHHTVVDGDGQVLKVENRTASESYNARPGGFDRYYVFPRDPWKDSQQVRYGPGPGGASPAGWLNSGAQNPNNIFGNNVNAYLDTNNDNKADVGGKPSVTDGAFLAAANLSASPSTTTNKSVAVQNLFYLNNVVHDILYQYGFTEAAGNFQADNFGKGGKGGDAVRAEAQDGGGTDNANFATPPDGKQPRMQMYLWSGAGPTHEVLVKGTRPFSVDAKGAQFGPAMTVTGVSGKLQLTNPSNGCSKISTQLGGKIAFIDRGSCTFVTKVMNAQAAGASAVVIYNTSGEAFAMSGSTGSIRIPAVMVGAKDGYHLRYYYYDANVTVHKLAVQPLMIDASLDSDVVYHEYGHGLTWRMIGGMDGPISGAIGEGMSDAVAMLINDSPVVGAYAASDSRGIRRYPYDAYPLHYGYVNGAEVHDDGEIYAAIIRYMMDITGSDWRPYLFGIVVDAMNYTPSSPSFEDMRDGLLAATANSAASWMDCYWWYSFANYGVGQGSYAVINGPSSVTTHPSFGVPTRCLVP